MADPIEHIIVLILENRSFDHMVGCLQSVNARIDGVMAAGGPRTNEYEGQSLRQTDGAQRTVFNTTLSKFINL